MRPKSQLAAIPDERCNEAGGWLQLYKPKVMLHCIQARRSSCFDKAQSTQAFLCFFTSLITNYLAVHSIISCHMHAQSVRVCMCIILLELSGMPSIEKGSLPPSSLADLAGTEVLRLLLWCSNVFWHVLAVPHRHSGRTWVNLVEHLPVQTDLLNSWRIIASSSYFAWHVEHKVTNAPWN